MEHVPSDSLFATMGNCLNKLSRHELLALEDAVLRITDPIYRKNGAKIRKLFSSSFYGTINAPRVGETEAREGKKEWDKAKKKQKYRTRKTRDRRKPAKKPRPRS